MSAKDFPKLPSEAGAPEPRRASDRRAVLDAGLEGAYDRLRSKAHALMRGGGLVSPTTLVHEAYLQLVGAEHFDLKSDAHAFYALAQKMRWLLVDEARSRAALRHGGAAVLVSLDEALGGSAVALDDILAVHIAMERLAPDYPEEVQVLELLYFGGLTHEEIATVRGVSTKTVQRLVRAAKALARKAIAGSSGRTGDERGATGR